MEGHSVWQLYIRQQGELEGYLFCVVVIYQTARRTGRVFILCGSYISDSKENWKGIYSVW